MPPPSPEPARSRFAGRVTGIPAAIEREMTGRTWEPGCPIGLEDLRLLRFNYLGMDGEIHRGPMVVNASVAEDVLGVFARLFDAGFQLKHVALAHRWRPNGPIETTRSVTASFNCRPALNPDLTPTGTWSEHAYGLAIDVNPLQNPYVAVDGSVRRPAAQAYLDRSQQLPGMIHPGDVVVRSFAEIGWEWGGNWSGTKDYMHFSLRGR
ncbi:MAG TPA: M15 family metallopeptidase [Actinomycetota bacterium]|nr:M15 family metallopeptidase [Actinomycetota bacterium]